MLLVAFLRGGADGLSLCAPYADAEYPRLRPTLALPRPGQASGGSLVDLDGHFGLHPALAKLKPLWEERRLAVLHAVGCYGLTRSHFDAQEFLETGTPGSRGTSTGWLDRCLLQGDRRSLEAGLALTPQLPRSFHGPQPVLVARDLLAFDFEAPGWRDEAEAALRRLYDHDAGPVGAVGRASLNAVALLKSTRALKDAPANGAVYPDGVVGKAFRQAACVIKSGLQTRCVFVDVEGDFDTHANQSWQNQKDYTELAASLAAFDRDLGARMERVVVMVVTEFGRTAAENGSLGTDHGSGGALFLLGGPVRGGRVHGRWPGLSRDQLFEGRDLAVTTDFRDAFGEVARKHLRVADSAALFPGYSPGGEPGVIA